MTHYKCVVVSVLPVFHLVIQVLFRTSSNSSTSFFINSCSLRPSPLAPSLVNAGFTNSNRQCDDCTLYRQDIHFCMTRQYPVPLVKGTKGKHSTSWVVYTCASLRRCRVSSEDAQRPLWPTRRLLHYSTESQRQQNELNNQVWRCNRQKATNWPPQCGGGIGLICRLISHIHGTFLQFYNTCTTFIIKKRRLNILSTIWFGRNIFTRMKIQTSRL